MKSSNWSLFARCEGEISLSMISPLMFVLFQSYNLQHISRQLSVFRINRFNSKIKCFWPSLWSSRATPTNVLINECWLAYAKEWVHVLLIRRSPGERRPAADTRARVSTKVSLFTNPRYFACCVMTFPDLSIVDINWCEGYNETDSFQLHFVGFQLENNNQLERKDKCYVRQKCLAGVI